MKVIFITGISSGLGLAIAKKTAGKDFVVYGSVRKETEHINGINYINMDITNGQMIKNAVNEIIKKEGRIDILINNAGYGVAGPLEFTGYEDAEQQMNVNFLGTFKVIKEVLPFMRKQNDGLIICISSIGGLIGLPFQGLYSASKFAIEGFCQSLRLELKPHNIDVVVINPGDFSTKFTSNRKIADYKSATEAYPAFAKSIKSIENDEHNGLNPEILAEKIEKILRKNRKKFRYIIASPLQKASVFVKNILSEKTFSKILGKYYKL